MLEDSFGDIIAKAHTGLDITRAQLAVMAGMEQERLASLESCQVMPTAAECQALAANCRLEPRALWQIACDQYCPTPPAGAGNQVLILPASSTRANVYIVPIDNSNQALVVDPGGDAEQILALASTASLRICGILITHEHHDHTGAVEEIRAELKVPVLVHATEFTRANVQALACPGHTAQSCAFLVGDALFTGDSLFAGSIGRAAHSGAYRQALDSGRKLLALPPETAVYPGHGPATTVQQERQHNPFLA